MDSWIPVYRYRGELVSAQCPQCHFLIVCRAPWRPWLLKFPGALLRCMRCSTLFREGMEWWA
jgi:hypothetical protein